MDPAGIAVAQESVESLGNQAALSCERCKIRKIKCDRTKPGCRGCAKASRSCLYPTVVQKPGPKPGVPQRKKRKSQGPGRNFRNYSPPSPAASSNSNADILKASAHGQLTFGLTTIRPQFQPDSSNRVSFYGVQNEFDQHLETQPALAPDPEPIRRGLALSQLLHPSHDPVEQNSSRDNVSKRSDEKSEDVVSNDVVLDWLCKELKINLESFQFLLSAYFENMTAFSLFHQPTFEAKLCAISSPRQRRALIAAMFAFSSRFKESSQAPQVDIPSPNTFRSIIEKAIDEALNACMDETPLLCLLQALILTTFHQLIKGVKGRFWRLVRTYIRIAYDIKLYTINKVLLNASKVKIIVTCPSHLDKEKRRA